MHKSISGSVTLIGALLVLLHLRYDIVVVREIGGCKFLSIHHGSFEISDFFCIGERERKRKFAALLFLYKIKKHVKNFTHKTRWRSEEA